MGKSRKIIAVCGAMLFEEKEYNFISEFNKACAENGYVALAISFSVDPIKHDSKLMHEEQLIALLKKIPCTAVVMMGESIDSMTVLEEIRDAAVLMGLPVFALDRRVEGCITISMRFGDGFKNMVKHVVEFHKCRRVYMLAGIRNNSFSEERISAYKEVLSENGIPFEDKMLAYGDFWDRPAREAVAGFLKEDELPEAIVCANDTMAIAACGVLQERGIRVPEDILVTGFDGLTSGMLNTPPISTVAPDYDNETSLILNILAGIENGEKADTATEHKIDFVVREKRSCGCNNIDAQKAMQQMRRLSLASNDQKWAVAAVNAMLLKASATDNILQLSPAVEGSIALWREDFYFVGVNSGLVEEKSSDAFDTGRVRGDLREAQKNGTTFMTLMRLQDDDSRRTGEHYDVNCVVPDFDELISDEKYEMFMMRLLYVGNDIYGYLIEGFRKTDNRSMRRCEEYAMFLSTAVNTVMKNQELHWLNDNLLAINQKMEQASIRDYLTGLFNRRGFNDEIAKIIENEANRGKYLTLFSVDMDDLKVINDTYGHNEGDLAIKALADAIGRFAARNGIAARYGGDEFACAIITDEVFNIEPDVVRERFDAVIGRNSVMSAKPYKVNASIGSSCTGIVRGLKLDDLMRSADEKMYHDKAERKKGR